MPSANPHYEHLRELHAVYITNAGPEVTVEAGASILKHPALDRHYPVGAVEPENSLAVKNE